MNAKNYEKVTVRLDKGLKSKVELLSENEKMKLSALIRELISRGLDGYYGKKSVKQEKLQRAETQALSESLYILRSMADKLEPTLREKASEHAKRVTAELFEE